MEQKFGKNSIDIKALREFCEREGQGGNLPQGERWARGRPRTMVRLRHHLPLNAIASFLCVTPQQLSRIRKAVTFSEK